MVSKKDKRLARCRNNPSNVSFDELVALLGSLGFVRDRTQGSHLIFVHARADVPFVNLQRVAGMAKPYQVRQVLELVDKYSLEVQ